MRTIIIGVSKPKTFKIGAELLKFWMNADFSHAYIKFNISEINREVVYHAAHGMVHFKNYEHFLEDNVAVHEFELEITDELYYKLLDKCIDLAGVKYAVSELVTIFLYDLLNNIGIKITTYNGKGYICSELVAEFLEELLHKKFNKPRFLITPNDIFLKLKET